MTRHALTFYHIVILEALSFLCNSLQLLPCPSLHWLDKLAQSPRRKSKGNTKNQPPNTAGASRVAIGLTQPLLSRKSNPQENGGPTAPQPQRKNAPAKVCSGGQRSHPAATLAPNQKKAKRQPPNRPCASSYLEELLRAQASPPSPSSLQYSHLFA